MTVRTWAGQCPWMQHARWAKFISVLRSASVLQGVLPVLMTSRCSSTTPSIYHHYQVPTRLRCCVPGENCVSGINANCRNNVIYKLRTDVSMTESVRVRVRKMRGRYTMKYYLVVYMYIVH
ncbi:hypothetical protein FOCC_FOCC002991 [Frankliniella occidentalis]|nr:hypothetical protein FOCC_FOCC002991 [Frankliniella occidentalis]